MTSRDSWLDASFLHAAALLSLTVVAGGATRAGAIGDVVLQFVSVPVLVAALLSLRGRGLPSSGWTLVTIVGAGVLLAIASLLPLPFVMPWTIPTRLMREDVIAALDLPASTLPVSTSPYATVLALLSGLPAAAVFLSVCRLEWRQRRYLTLVVIGIGLISVVLGLLQVAQGPQSALRLFEVTNPGDAVGFFANRNHFAALLYVLLAFAAAWSVRSAQIVAAAPRRRRYDGDLVVPLILSLTTVVLLVSAQLFSRSRAGLGLTIAGLVGSAMLSTAGKGAARGVAARLAVGAGLIGVLLALQVGFSRVADRFADDPLADARLPIARGTIEAVKAYLPFGAGLGSFVSVYGVFEKPADALLDRFVNRAHDDLLEFALEMGVPGAILLVAAFAWLAVVGGRVWLTPHRAGSDIDVMLARAASLSLVLLLVHSIVDYPLRTSAMLSVLAFAAALLVPASGGAD